MAMQQPPLSQQIRALERDLDVQLFYRRARGVELTVAGRAFLDDARSIVATLSHAVETTRRTARGERGRICVGVTPTGPFHPFVPRVIRAFRDAFPMIHLKLEESISNELIEHLHRQRLDAAFVRVSVAESEGLTVHPLLEEPLMVAMPGDRARMAGGKRGDAGVTLKSLAGETFIAYGRTYGPAPYGTSIHDTTIAACRAAGFNPRFGQEVDRPASALNLVAAGLGICLVPASVQRMNLDGVEYRPLKGKVRPKAILNLTSRRGDPSPVVRQFSNFVRRAARNFA
jgi:DNA-binding transcriptional LysR family regulator